MVIDWYSRIRKYYIEGYGCPKQYYSDEDLNKFVPKFISEEQRDQLYIEKQKKLGTYVEPESEEPNEVQGEEVVNDTTIDGTGESNEVAPDQNESEK